MSKIITRTVLIYRGINRIESLRDIFEYTMYTIIYGFFKQMELHKKNK